MHSVFALAAFMLLAQRGGDTTSTANASHQCTDRYDRVLGLHRRRGLAVAHDHAAQGGFLRGSTQC